MDDRNREMARRVAEAAARCGGRCYYVGGCVRDPLRGQESKDVDIEVHGVPLETLEGILDTLGERVSKGASFGVLGLRHWELDIALPRSETATGRGHRDFAVSVDPFLGPERAARRRDFTINALMRDVLTGELLDFFHGREDLERGLIRHVDEKSFGEDPLRVFRAAQFAARFEYTVVPGTRELCAAMAVEALAPERVMEELKKALLKAERPSIFFEELEKMRQLGRWFPEVEALRGVPQNPRFHPEGDVWTHTLRVLDEAAALRAEAADPLALMLAALCHDFGKAVTTEEIGGVLHAYGHEIEGQPLIERFLRHLTRETKLRENVLSLTRLHMEPNKLPVCGAGEKAYMRLFDRALCPEDLLLLAKADDLGRAASESDRAAMAESYRPVETKLREMLALYHERMSRPCVMGRDLIEAGARPGPQFTEALACVRKLRLAGRPKKEQLSQALACLRKGKK